MTTQEEYEKKVAFLNLLARAVNERRSIWKVRRVGYEQGNDVLDIRSRVSFQIVADLRTVHVYVDTGFPDIHYREHVVGEAIRMREPVNDAIVQFYNENGLITITVALDLYMSVEDLVGQITEHLNAP